MAYSHAAGATALATLREGMLRLAGNQIVDDHDRSALPLVRIRMGASTGACTFADNQCTLLVAGAVPAIVAIAAPRLAISNNIVRRLRNDRDAMHLDCRVVGDRPAATVIGNVTFGNIRLNGGPLPAAFVPLNILSQ